MAENTTMQKQMTIQEAQKILNSNSFINYSYDELLEAVNTLKGDPTQKDLVEGFYKKFDTSLKETGVEYREFDKIRSIFEGTKQGQKWEEDIKRTAQSLSKVLSEKDVELSFADADEARVILSLVPQSNEIRSAQSKLNDIVIAKMEKLIEGKEYVDIHELEAAQNLVNGIANKEKKVKAQKKLDEVLKSYEDENGLSQDVEVLRKNDKSLDETLESIRLYAEDGKVSEELKELAPVLANVEIVEDDGSVVDEEKKAKNLTLAFEAAKLEAYQENVGNVKYLLATKNEQRKQLTEKVRDLFVAKLGMAGIASTFELPTAEEQQNENKFKAYMERKTKAAEDFVTRLVKGGEKLQIKVRDIITACADTDVEVSKFKDILEAKLGKGKSVLGKRLKAFREKSVSLWGKAYEVSRKVVKNVKEHKWQHIANTAATLAVAMSGYGTAAIIGYAAYSAAGAWVWPVVAEAQKQRAAAKAKGEKIGFWDSMKTAWQTKKTDKDYKRQSWFGMVGAVAGGLLGAGGTTMGLDKVSSRVLSGLARTASSISAQTTAMIVARKEYKKSPTEENRSKWKAAKTSFYIGLGISAVGSWLSLRRLNSNVAEHIDTITGAGRSHTGVAGVGAENWQDSAQPSTPLREGWGKMPEVPSAGDNNAVADGVDTNTITDGTSTSGGTAATVTGTEAHTAGADAAIELGGKFQRAVNIEMKFGAHSDSWFDSRSSLAKFDNIIIRDAADGGNMKLSAQEFLDYAKDVDSQGLLEGKPEGMSVSEYVYRYNMLREQVGFSGNLAQQRIQLNKELLSLGFKEGDWERFLEGNISKAEADKLFQTHLGPHLARTLIDRDINCGEVNVVQQEIIHRGLATIDTSGEVYGRSGYYVGAGHVRPEDNRWTGNEAHYHIDDDCSGKGDLHQAKTETSVARKDFGSVGRDVDFDNDIKKTDLPPVRPGLDIDMSYGESQYDIPEYQQKMTEGVGTFERTVPGEVKWAISGPHGQHPIPEDATVTINKETGEMMIQYSDGRAPEFYDKSALRKITENVTETYEEPIMVSVPYTPLSDQTVNEAAALAGCKPGELTKTSIFNGTSQFKMFTEDGVVNIRVGKDNVPHFTMTNMDGSEAVSVPTKIVEGRFKEADAMLRNHEYTSIPAKNEVAAKILQTRVGRGGFSK